MEKLLKIKINLENGKIIEDEQFETFKKETYSFFDKRTIYWFYDVTENDLFKISHLRRYKVELENRVFYFVVCHLRSLEDIATKELFSVFQKDDSRLSFVRWITNNIDDSNIKFRLDTIIEKFSKIKNIDLSSSKTITITGLEFISSFLKSVAISSRFNRIYTERNGIEIPFVPPESKGHFEF